MAARKPLPKNIRRKTFDMGSVEIRIEPFAPPPMLDEILEKLFNALRAEYPSDPTAPGVVGARLSDGRYYCSVVRYTSSYGEGKKILCQGSGPTYRAAVIDAARTWTRSSAHRDQLARMVA